MFGKRPQNFSTMLKKKAPNKSHIGEFVSDPDFPLILPPLYNPRTDQQSPVATGLCGSSTVSRFACCLRCTVALSRVLMPVVSHSHGRKKGLTGRMPVERMVRLVAIQKRRDSD